MIKAGDENWRLVARYSNLFRRPDGSGTSGYPEVGDGWQDLLERAAARIAAAVADEPAGAGIHINQIKQKFGTLRFYFDARKLSKGALAKVEEAIDLAEARSECTCENCGAKGRLYDSAGWYSTRCGDHADGNPVRIRPGRENLRIEQIFRRGKAPVWRCRRYDRAVDTFVDVPLPNDFKESEGW